jgi:hypothetical protein
VDQQVHLYNEQGPGDSGLSRAFFDAANITIANGDLARGRIFAERALSAWQTSSGSDCEEVIQHGYLKHDPSKLEIYGMTMKWKTAVDEIPSGLEPGDYEDWLWKRDKPQHPGNPVGEGQKITTSTGKEVVEPAGKPYAIREITGKGKGLVATTKITKGTRLLSEVPLFKVPRDNPDIKALEHIVENEVNSLDADQRHTFFDLANIYGNTHSQSFGIARTNVLPLGSSARSGGLFLEASRINHSCRHNAQNTWNENIGRLTIHALRDIEAGQEITITYLANTSESAERKRFLAEKFKFECKCELCLLPRARRRKSDARLKELQTLDKLVGTFFVGDLEPKTALHLLHKMLGLFDREGIWDASIARAYKDAYEIATENDDGSRARIFAQRAYDARRLIEGDDSPDTAKMKQAAEKLSAQTPPLGMNEAQLENWLWGEAKS